MLLFLNSQFVELPKLFYARSLPVLYASLT